MKKLVCTLLVCVMAMVAVAQEREENRLGWNIALQGGAHYSAFENTRHASFGDAVNGHVGLSVGYDFSHAIGARAELSYGRNISGTNTVESGRPLVLYHCNDVSLFADAIFNLSHLLSKEHRNNSSLHNDTSLQQPEQVCQCKIHCKRCSGYTQQPFPEGTLIHRQITGNLTGLSVDTKGKLLSVPLGIENPNRIQRRLGLTIVQTNVGVYRLDPTIAGRCIRKGILRCLFDSLIGSDDTFFGVHIILIRQITGQIRRLEIHRIRKIIRFN